MTLYAESSAVSGWLLGEPHGQDAHTALSAADSVIASRLTLVECDRAILRAATLNHITRVTASERRAWLGAAAANWDLLEVDAAILDRARQPFPGEPLRTLDAIHLASALSARVSVGELRLLSLDRRIRTAAAHLGFLLVP